MNWSAEIWHFTPAEITAILLSVKTSLIATIISVPLALYGGWVFARKTFWGKNLLEGILQIPLVMPPVTTGIVLLLLFGKNGLIGTYLFRHLGIQLAFSQTAVVLAAIVVSFPLVIRSIRAAIEMVDPSFDLAARSLGKDAWGTFFHVTLPMASPGIIRGVILGFARCLGEFGATITFAGNIAGITQTIPLAMYVNLQIPGKEMEMIRLAVVSILIAFTAMASAELLNRKVEKR